MASTKHLPSTREPAWLLLVHELPARPSNARVKTWRRLQNLGAVAVKDSVYVLPNTPQAREDFEWVRTEVLAMKGQATVFAADAVDAVEQDEIAEAFRNARRHDYQEIAGEARELLAAVRGRRGGPAEGRLRRAAQALRDRLGRVQAIDFFRASGADEASGAVGELQHRLEHGPGAGKEKPKEGETRMTSYRARTWVTRPRPGIDRMASAWLIRRFIDPKAKFQFAEKPKETSAAVPFDMFGVEFGHQGDRCTFETLASRFGVAHPAVKRLGQVVHDLDLKEERYGLPEAVAVGRLVEGLRQMYTDSHELLDHGMTMMEALYQSWAGSGEGAGQRSARAGRSSRARSRRLRP